jgi:hypothetical protein
MTTEKRKNVPIREPIHYAAKIQAAREGKTITQLIEERLYKFVATRLEVQKMQDAGAPQVKEFGTPRECWQYFCNFCDDHNLEYGDTSFEAGGVGHDYRITLIFE